MENVAYRGFSAVTPENTLTSFRRAAQAGCRRIATELRLSRDAQIFCFADPSLHRVTGTHGWLHRLEAEDIRRRPVPFGGNAFRVERIAPLDGLLAFADGEELGLLLSIPSGTSPRWRNLAEPTTDAVLAALDPWRGRIDILLASADRRILRRLKERSKWPVGALVDRSVDGFHQLDEPRIDFLVGDRKIFVSPHRRRHPDDFLHGGLELLDECRRLGRRFYLGPVRKRAELRRLLRLEPDGLLTPHTAQLEALRHSPE